VLDLRPHGEHAEPSVSSMRRNGSAATWTNFQAALAIFVLALGAGLAMTFVVFHAQTMVDSRFDPYSFGEMGKSVARGDGFQGFGPLLGRRAPLYPWMIGALYYLFGEKPLLVLLVQCLMHATTCVVAFDIGRRLLNKRTGVIAGLALALHPMMLRYVGDLHLETQLTFMTTLVVWLSVRFYEGPSLHRGAMLGLAAGCAALTKAVVLLYPGLFAIGMVLAGVRSQQGRRNIPVLPLVVLFAAMGTVILPWTYRQYRETGHFVLISTGFSDAFLRGMVFSRTEFITLQKPPYTDAENEVNAYFARLRGPVPEKDDWANEQILNQEMRRRLVAEPALVARKFVVGLFTFWYQMTSLANSALTGGVALVAWLLAFMGLPRARAEGRPVWLLLLPVVYLNVMLAALLALGRYSAPVTPALWVLAAFGVDTLLMNMVWRHRSTLRSP